MGDSGRLYTVDVRVHSGYCTRRESYMDDSDYRQFVICIEHMYWQQTGKNITVSRRESYMNDVERDDYRRFVASGPFQGQPATWTAGGRVPDQSMAASESESESLLHLLP